MAIRWPWRRVVLPPPLRAALREDEHIQAVADLTDGTLLAASRFGLWHIDGDDVSVTGWESIAKARLTGSVLSIIPTQLVGGLFDSTVVLADDITREYLLAGRSSLTDEVHNRVRRSVVASGHFDSPGGGGWVVLRRVPGRDGLVTQVRLDPGADPAAFGFADAVAELASELAGGPTPS